MSSKPILGHPAAAVTTPAPHARRNSNCQIRTFNMALFNVRSPDYVPTRLVTIEKRSLDNILKFTMRPRQRCRGRFSR